MKAPDAQERRERSLLARLHGDWIEIAAAVLLSLATLASTWSAYQAARWHGHEARSFNEATAMRVRGAELSEKADSQFVADVVMFISYVGAFRDRDAEALAFFEDRLFGSELKSAVEAWKATDPLYNPQAPRSPFLMPEYVIGSRVESGKMEELAQEKSDEARRAIEHADRYVLFTVLFASVLFFAGISTKFKNPPVRAGVILLGAVLYLAAFAVLLFQPIR